MVGVAYAVGFVVAQWEWGNVVTFSALIWIFLPFYIRGGLYTMPEFLERRYNAHCRHLFAVCCLVLWIVAQMAVVMLAGAKAMRGMFDLDETLTIVVLALLSGSYTIYGGLKSVAWTDFLQFIVMMIGGLVVAVVGLAKVGGLRALMYANPEKFKIIYPANGSGLPLVRCLDALSVRGHLVQLHQPVHRAALPGSAQRVGCPHGRRVCRLHENHPAAVGRHTRHHRLPALSRIARHRTWRFPCSCAICCRSA